MMICSVEGCNNTNRIIRGMCFAHYIMWRKHGDSKYADKGLHKLGYANQIEDFWKSVKKRREKCWEWMMSKDKDGYGFFWYGNRQWRAHRFLAKFIMGMDIDGKVVCHSCDNPGCVNPDHIFIGSCVDNVRDMVSKERVARGEMVRSTKMTREKVVEARRMSSRGVTNRAIAESMGISEAQMGCIIRRKFWKHV